VLRKEAQGVYSSNHLIRREAVVQLYDFNLGRVSELRLRPWPSGMTVFDMSIANQFDATPVKSLGLVR